MCLGQAILYIDNKQSQFMIECANQSILGVKQGNFTVCKRFGDERLQGDVLNTEIEQFSVYNNMIVIIV